MSEKVIQKYIKVDEIHTVAYREYGNPQGIPVLMLHGGPGGSINYQIIELIDLNFSICLRLTNAVADKVLPKVNCVRILPSIS